MIEIIKQIEKKLEGNEYSRDGVSYYFTYDQVPMSFGDTTPLKNILKKYTAIGEEDSINLTEVIDRKTDFEKISNEWHFEISIKNRFMEIIDNADGYYYLCEDGDYISWGNVYSIYRIIWKKDEFVLIEFYICD